jgi:hypothetical protein
VDTDNVEVARRNFKWYKTRRAERARIVNSLGKNRQRNGWDVAPCVFGALDLAMCVLVHFLGSIFMFHIPNSAHVSDGQCPVNFNVITREIREEGSQQAAIMAVYGFLMYIVCICSYKSTTPNRGFCHIS